MLTAWLCACYKFNIIIIIIVCSPAKHITRLQRVQNAAARIVPQKSAYLSSVDTLRELHWLPIQWRIKFKLASLTFKATHNEVPPISPVFLFLIVHPVFSGHLFLPTSCRSLALTLFSVLAPFMPLYQRFGILFLTLSVHPIQLTLSAATWKHSISKLLLIPQRLGFTCD